MEETSGTKTVEVALSSEEYEWLEEVARRDGTTVAQIFKDGGRRQAAIRESVQFYEDGDSFDRDAIVAGEIPPPPIARQVGFEAVSREMGRAVVEFQAGPEHMNPMGTVQGGVLCDVGDAAMGIAFSTLLDEGESFTTVELKANYLKPVFEETLTAVGEVVRKGRTIGLVECDVNNEDGDLVARLSSTCLVMEDDQEAQ